MKMVNVKQHIRKATIWDNLFIELATINRTLAITAEQLAKKVDVKQAQEYHYWVKKRRKLEKTLFRGF